MQKMKARQSKTSTKMATEVDEKSVNIHHKYCIKKTAYKEEDLEKLKNIIEPFFQSNENKRQNIICLQRFLKAFLTPEDACSAIIRYIEWRDKFNVDALKEDDDDIVKEHQVGRSIILKDKDSYGRPIVLVEVRLHNPSLRDMHSITKYTIFMLELLSSKCNEDVIDNFCIIFDLQGFSLKNMDYTYVKRLIWILQNCYPERLGVCLIVNSPWVFYGCWSIIKLWLNEVTASKIIFIRNQEDIGDFIDVDKLPRKLF